MLRYLHSRVLHYIKTNDMVTICIDWVLENFKSHEYQVVLPQIWTFSCQSGDGWSHQCGGNFQPIWSLHVWIEPTSPTPSHTIEPISPIPLSWYSYPGAKLAKKSSPSYQMRPKPRSTATPIAFNWQNLCRVSALSAFRNWFFSTTIDMFFVLLYYWNGLG